MNARYVGSRGVYWMALFLALHPESARGERVASAPMEAHAASAWSAERIALPGEKGRAGVRLQAGSITGRVIDVSTGSGLSGVRVRVIGTTMSAVTNGDGRYSVPGIPSGQHRVEASHGRYSPQTQTVSVTAGPAVADFRLSQQAVLLDEVVAVGYGTQRKRDITGAVASVQLDEARSTPVTSVEQVLQGRAAGVQVVQNNGAPGGGMSVQIRGTKSITAGSQPLYVIDGVPAFVGSGSRDAMDNPLTDLDPTNIESIEVLKDASSAAIYGARGANGVVLITTRRGVRGENTVRMESSYGMQEISRTVPVLNAQQFAELHNEARATARLPAAYTAEQIAGLGRGTDWQDEIFQAAPVQNHSLTVSGGDEKTRYLVGMGLLDQEGIVIGSAFRRFSGRLNLDREVSTAFRIGSSLSLARSEGNITPTDVNVGGGGVVSTALEFSPVSPVRAADGTYVRQNPLQSPIPNPVATALDITDVQSSSRLVGNLFGEYDLTDALLLRVSLGGTAGFSRDKYYAPGTTAEGQGSSGAAQVSSGHSTNVVNDNVLTYRRSVRSGHDLDLTGGITLQTFSSSSLSAGAQQFATDITGPNNLGAGALPLSPGTAANEWTLLSYLARANYQIAGRYLFTATGRYDGSSRFGANNKWAMFPSAAFAWRLSEEPLLEDVEWLSDAKVRLSYGVTGNQEIGTYRSLARLTSGVYVLGSNRVVTYGPSTQSPNPSLKWESSEQLNGGVDLTLWDGRVSLTADAYTGTTTDLLLEVPLPRISGFSSQLQNVGSVRNRGIELSVSTVNLETDRFSWETNLNLTRNRNRVLDLGPVTQILPGGRISTAVEGGQTSIVRVGDPLGSFFGYRTSGIWQLGEEDAMRASGDPDAAAGEWRYVDTNADGRIDAADRTVLGSAQADLFGGLTNNFTFGRLSLGVFLQGTFGNEVVNGPAIWARSVTTSTNEHASSYRRWTPDNPSNDVPRANLNRRRRLIDGYVEDGSYLRLQTVSLGYRVPGGVVPGSGEARLFASGQNLWLSDSYSGYDPEVNSYGGDPMLRGIDFGSYPRSRTINLGIDVTF